MKFLDRLQMAHFTIERLSHEKWEWVAEIEKDGIRTKGIAAKKQTALVEAYRAWKIQKAHQNIPGEPPTLGVKAADHMQTSDKVR